mgnify:FL=1|tara:strand:+ start:1661 stop:1834 length:174 start_codon:yes stop_codon:yes gene_type:complete
MIFALTLLLVVVKLAGAASGLTWLMVFIPMIAYGAYLLSIFIIVSAMILINRLRNIK